MGNTRQPRESCLAWWCSVFDLLAGSYEQLQTIRRPPNALCKVECAVLQYRKGCTATVDVVSVRCGYANVSRTCDPVPRVADQPFAGCQRTRSRTHAHGHSLPLASTRYHLSLLPLGCGRSSRVCHTPLRIGRSSRITSRWVVW